MIHSATCAADFLTIPETNGTAEPDTLEGSSGTDRLRRLDGDDTIRGMDGDDFVNGHAGNSRCSVDWLSGDAGDDTYKIGNGDGKVITLPDLTGSNALECAISGGVTVSDEGADRYLLGTGVVVKITGFNSGMTRISLVGCN